MFSQCQREQGEDALYGKRLVHAVTVKTCYLSAYQPISLSGKAFVNYCNVRHPVSSSASVNVSHPVSSSASVNVSHPVSSSASVNVSHPVSSSASVNVSHPVSSSASVNVSHGDLQTSVNVSHPYLAVLV